MQGCPGCAWQLQLLQHQADAPIKHLRVPNPYVLTALGDWRKHHALEAVLPRQPSAGVGRFAAPIAGTSSMGMSGVNAHLLLSGSNATAAQISQVTVCSISFTACIRLKQKLPDQKKSESACCHQWPASASSRNCQIKRTSQS